MTMKHSVKKWGFVGGMCLLILGLAIPVWAQPISGVDPSARGSITINRFAGNSSGAPTSGTALNGIPYQVELVRFREGVAQTADNLRNPEFYDVIPGGFEQTLNTANGVAVFSDLPQGIFRVTELHHTVTPENDRVAPFIVALPRQDVDGTWLFDVTVYPKTEEDSVVTFGKELDLVWDETRGEMVANWRLEAVLPRLIGNATRFEFVDELNDNLIFIPGSVVGHYQRLTPSGDGFVQTDETLPTNAFDVTFSEDNVLSIGLTPAGFSYLSANALLAPEGRVVFTFATAIATDEHLLGPIYNEARLYYNDDEGVVTGVPPGEFEQFALEIEKIDVGGRYLREATFELFFDEAGTIPIFPVNGVNRQFETVDGVVLIPALEAGTVFLREVIAPDGYRTINILMPVVVGREQTTPERPNVVTVQVIGEVEGGWLLPETGGLGTIMLSVTGIILIGGSITLFMVAKNRRRNEGRV